MKKESKQLKLNIKGTILKFWNTLYLKHKIKKMGVEVHNLKHVSYDNVEIVVSGQKQNLWDVINWSKGQDLFFILDEVVFEFSDIAVK